MDYKSRYDISADFKKPKYQIINIKQGSYGMQEVFIHCTDDGVPVKLDNSTSEAIVKLKKPDNRDVINHCDITDDGLVKLTITEEISRKAGRCYAEIRIYNKSQVSSSDLDDLDDPALENAISTMDICINIYPSAIQNPDITSKDEFTAFDYLVSKMIKDYIWILNEAKGIIGSVKTINGRGPDDDGAFEFNAEDYQPLIDQTIDTAKKSGMFDGKDGIDGIDGKTPQKFVDYFTEEDLVELGMVSTVCGKKPDSGTRNVSISCKDIGAVSLEESKKYVYIGDEGNVSMKNARVVDIGEPISNSDSANKGYVDKKINDEIQSSVFYADSILTTDWIGESIYANTIPVQGINSKMSPHISPNYAAIDDVEEVIESWKYIYRAVSGDNKITFYATGELPKVEIPIRIEVINR